MNRDEAKNILLLYRPGLADTDDPQIAAPAGLKEQIISEQAAQERMQATRRQFRLALAAVVLVTGLLAVYWFPRHTPEDTLAVYQNQMASAALRGYAMDLLTNDATAIRAYLVQNRAPADFTLTDSLGKTALAGCAIEDWQGKKVSMICFRTGRPLPPGVASDLWLFVADRAAVKNLPAGAGPQLARVNRLITATWTQGDKVYLLGMEGDEQAIRQYL